MSLLYPNFSSTFCPSTQMATAASPLPSTARLLLPSTQPPHCLAHSLPAVRFNSVGRGLAARATAVTSPTPSPPLSSSGIVLVDRSEAGKANRLKSAYLEKVVPLLKEEFGYKNIHEVRASFLTRVCLHQPSL